MDQPTGADVVIIGSGGAALRADGLADQFVTDGAKYARACYTGPHTANQIHEALRREFRPVGPQDPRSKRRDDLRRGEVEDQSRDGTAAFSAAHAALYKIGME